jgi:uridine phosphorylase
MNNSHDDILIHPKREKGEKKIPSAGILLVNPSEARIGMRMLLDAGGRKCFLFHSELVVSESGDFFVAGPAVGAPMAAMTLEKLVVLGAKSVFMYGWCGAISPEYKVGDILLGGKAHCGEGTSRYYSSEMICHPSQVFVERVKNCLRLSAPEPLWTTDAVYRESRKMFKELADRYNVCGVDMEYSALCAVATFRKIDFAAMFLVSDELWQRDWCPGFAGKAFKAKSRTQIEQLIENIVEFSSF